MNGKLFLMFIILLIILVFTNHVFEKTAISEQQEAAQGISRFTTLIVHTQLCIGRLAVGVRFAVGPKIETDFFDVLRPTRQIPPPNFISAV